MFRHDRPLRRALWRAFATRPFAILMIGLLGSSLYFLATHKQSLTTSPETAPTPHTPLPAFYRDYYPAVWIDRPLPMGELKSGEPVVIIAHAAGVNGRAELWVWDESDSHIGVSDLGSPVNIFTAGSQLARYEGEWIPFYDSVTDKAKNNPPFVVYKLRVFVEGVFSEPIPVRIYPEETP